MENYIINNLPLSEYSCRDFISALAGNSPAPGGGGASALIGAVAIALGNMIGSLTVHNAKYQEVHDEIQALKKEADALQETLMSLIQEDADAFGPLAKAYKMPNQTEEEKEQKRFVMERALDTCCQVPIKIMESCAKSIVLLEEFAKKGSVMAISDAGVGAAACEAALRGGFLNVRINTKSMKNREKAAQYNDQAERLIQKYVPRAEKLFLEVNRRFD